MPRKKREYKRDITPDPKFHDQLVAKAINTFMRAGKKGLAERALYSALNEVKEKTNKEPLEVFYEVVEKIQPLVEVRSRRVGGATYQVPTEVPERRGKSLALRWLKAATNSRNEKTLAKRLAAEMLDALNNRGAAIKKREDTHKMAEANKAFAHFKF